MTPEGWRRVPLSACAKTITSGGTPKVGRADFYGGDIPFLKIDDITSAPSLRISAAKATISRKALEDTSAKLYPAGTVLVTMYGTIGAVGISQVPLAANQAIAALYDLDDTTPEYLAYLSLSTTSTEETPDTFSGAFRRDRLGCLAVTDPGLAVTASPFVAVSSSKRSVWVRGSDMVVSVSPGAAM